MFLGLTYRLKGFVGFFHAGLIGFLLLALARIGVSRAIKPKPSTGKPLNPKPTHKPVKS